MPVKISFCVTHRVVALEGLERVESVHWRGITNPLQGLVVGDNPNILHCVDLVQEVDEALLVMRLREPGGMVVKSERRTVGGVMALKVLHDHLGHTLSLWGIGTGVSHGATATVQVLPHHHGHFPDTWIALGRARRDHAVVEDLVVQGVRPAGRSVLVDGHGRVIGKVGVVEHLEHLVATDGEEGSAHSADILQLNTTVGGENFTLSSHFTVPFLLGELFTEAVTVIGKGGG